VTQFFNALHAPLGAHSSFTLGCLGRHGGLGLERGGPANDNVYIGVEAREGGRYETLPFYEGSEDESRRYDHAKKAKKAKDAREIIVPFAASAIERDFQLGTDRWSAGDLTFTVYSLAEGIPEPGTADDDLMQRLVCPAVVAELTIDNSRCDRPRRAYFGYAPTQTQDAMHVARSDEQLKGVTAGQHTGIYSDSRGVTPAIHFGPKAALLQTDPFNYNYCLGRMGLMLCHVPAGQKRTFRFAICFFRGGQVTTGLPCSYYYSRFYRNIDEVGAEALASFSWFKRRAGAANKWLSRQGLNGDQQWMMAHAIRSYYGSTQLLDHRKKPVWVVNEGEYRMMNTFDLTVDQVFFEMKMNPWTVRNELDLFTSRYSYTDTLHLPGGENEHPGGISFTHDMGVKNHFTDPGLSSYELAGLTGCFSHMTHEQLVNWILCSAVYAKGSGDEAWLKRKLPVFKRCLASMLNRDHPEAAKRNGLMSLDSSRTRHGAEITTYDSLDASLGQSRNNVYLAVKGWASYVAMERIFRSHGLSKQAATCRDQAMRAADTIAGHMNSNGFIPAIMGEPCDSAIIPAIEGLVFPYVLGQKKALDEDGPYGELIVALKKHLKTVLTKGVCLYEDGGWKLSSSADNSWLSKIYLCQFVARQVLGMRTRTTGAAADRAHAAWLCKDENLPFAWSDQMRSGVAHGSKYYPRGVTSILWCDEGE
jgi:hypothetical protein